MVSFRHKLVFGGVLIYLMALGLVFVVGEYKARDRAEKLLDISVEQIQNDLQESADAIVAYIGKTIVGDRQRPGDLSEADIRRYMKELSVDEVNVIDKSGRIVLADDAGFVGMDFAVSVKAHADYGALLDGRKTSVVEPVRGSVDRPDILRKYGAFAFPEAAGFVQVGLDAKRIVRDFGYVYERVAVDWKVGESGYFIVADAATGQIYSTLDAGKTGTRLQDAVPDLLFSEKDFKRTKRVKVFGEHCFIRDGYCQGFRVLAVIPEREVVGARNASVSVAAAVLLGLFLVFGTFLHRTNRRNLQMRRFFENEKRQAEKDLAMAKAIQANALPSVFPPFPRLVGRIDLHAAMRTAKEVGGDFYDFYTVGPDKLAVVIADVSGKGVPAAMFMMRAKSTLQGLLRGGGDIAEAVTRTNRRLSDGNDASMFVTAWIGVVDLATGRVEYVNAGHNPPVVKRHGGGLAWLRERSGPPLASFDGVTYRKREFALSPGDGIFLYTDGVTEANDRALELFGEDRLLRSFKSAVPLIGAVAPRSSKELCDDLFVGLDQFVAGAEQADDITMLAFKLNGVERTFPATDLGLRDALPYLEMFQNAPRPKVIMDEIVSNIVRCSGARLFTIRIVQRTEGVELTFTDDGKAFDPTAEVRKPAISAGMAESDLSGLGLFMVKKMSKSVRYSRVDDRNRLTVLL